MNGILVNLMNSICAAKDVLSEAEDARDAFLEPILKALGATGGGVSHCSIDQGELHVSRSGSCRGSRWDHDYAFPLDIFTHEDPLKAAAEYVAAKKRAREAADRSVKRAEIQRLQKELDAAS